MHLLPLWTFVACSGVNFVFSILWCRTAPKFIQHGKGRNPSTIRTRPGLAFCFYMNLQRRQHTALVFKWFIPVVCDYSIKYQNDIRWVSQNTTLYYGVGCQKIDNMFRPFSIRPSSGLTWWTKEEKITMLQSTYTCMLWLGGECWTRSRLS